MLEGFIADMIEGMAEGHDPTIGLAVAEEECLRKRTGVLERLANMLEMCREATTQARGEGGTH